MSLSFTTQKMAPLGPEFDGIHPTAPYTIHFFAEGYSNSQSDKDSFLRKCRDAMAGLRGIRPFHLITAWPQSIAFYTHFSPSANAISLTTTAPAANNSVFQSYYSSSSNWEYDTVLLNNALQSAVIKITEATDTGEISTSYCVSELITPSIINSVYTHRAMVVIFCKTDSSMTSGLCMRITQKGTYASILSFNHNFSNPNLAKCIARSMGNDFLLGAELEFTETDVNNIKYYEPTGTDKIQQINTYENLIYMENGPASGGTVQSDKLFKWYKYLDANQRNGTIPVANHQPSSSMTGYNPPVLTSNIHGGSIELLQGGGGYRNKVYRTANSCLMKSTFKNSYNQILIDGLDYHFCPICTAILKNKLSGSFFVDLGLPITIDKQLSKFDTVPWDNVNRYEIPANSNMPQSATVSLLLEQNMEYWEYKYSVKNHSNPSNTDYRGLLVENIKVKGQRRTMVIEDVASYMKFNDIKVKFKNETGTENFNLYTALRNGKAILTSASNNYSSSSFSVSLFQSGLKLRMEDDFGGTCKVIVECSVAFRHPNADFDPGKSGMALKCFPQITFSWEPIIDENTGLPYRIVEKLYGNIEHNVTTHHMAGCGNMGGNNTDENFADFYADSNVSVIDAPKIESHLTNSPSRETWKRRGKAYLPTAWLTDPGNIYELATTLGSGLIPDLDPPIPNPPQIDFTDPDWFPLFRTPAPSWTNLFDYYLRSEYASSFERIGVYGPEDGDKFNSLRENVIEYPLMLTPPAEEPDWQFRVVKVARQGCYDNVHVSGDMGKYESPNIFTRVMAAPFCAEDCWHLHWRWGVMAELIAPVAGTYFDFIDSFFSIQQDPSNLREYLSTPSDHSKGYRGWDKNPLTSTASTSLFAPMIPPNQKLTVGVINSSDNKSKTVQYKVEVIAPHYGQKQVLMEHGWAWAARPASAALLTSFYLNPVANWIDPFPATAPNGQAWNNFISDLLQTPAAINNRSMALRQAYLRMRFFEKDGAYENFSQVPEGTFSANSSIPGIETL